MSLLAFGTAHAAPVSPSVRNPIYGTAQRVVTADFFALNTQSLPSGSGGWLTMPCGRLMTFDYPSVHWRSLRTGVKTFSGANLLAFVNGARAAGINKGTYQFYGCPTDLALNGAAVAGPYGGLGEGSFPSDVTEIDAFWDWFLPYNAGTLAGFFDSVQIMNEPDWTQAPSNQRFFWRTKAEFVEYHRRSKLKCTPYGITVYCAGTFSMVSANTGLDQWLGVASSGDAAVFGYQAFDAFAGHTYHARPNPAYPGFGDVTSCTSAGMNQMASMLAAYGRTNVPFGETEWGISSNSGDTEITDFLAWTAADRCTLIARNDLSSLARGVTFKALWSLDNAGSYSGNLRTDTLGSIKGRTDAYNGTVGKTVGQLQPDGRYLMGAWYGDKRQELCFADGTSFIV